MIIIKLKDSAILNNDIYNEKHFSSVSRIEIAGFEECDMSTCIYRENSMIYWLDIFYKDIEIISISPINMLSFNIKNKLYDIDIIYPFKNKIKYLKKIPEKYKVKEPINFIIKHKEEEYRFVMNINQVYNSRINIYNFIKKYYGYKKI